MRNSAISVVLLPLAFAVMPSVGEEPVKAPEWARNLRLVVSGGPAISDIEISLNGEFVLDIGDQEAGLFHQVADLVRPGLNELKVALAKPEQARAAGEKVEIAVVRVEESERRVRTEGRPLAEVTVPGDVSADTPCAETIRFLAGPVSPAPPDLKNRYWLFITGPPARSRVTVKVNDAVVGDAASGNTFIEVTHAVLKGKNVALFELRPTCLVEKSGRDGMLTFSIAPATLEIDTVRQTEGPQATVDIDPKRVEEPRTIKRAFRAW